ncbi:MAG: hypothetical protein VKO01_12125 [Cyanobacteriota bacterium]|nr:hypothetical protein [Cyanobacteriota bacterium]
MATTPPTYDDILRLFQETALFLQKKSLESELRCRNLERATVLLA